jgi:hypothetical protein
MSGSEGTETREIEFGVVLDYTLGGTTVLHNLTARKDVTISRVKSSALTTCENEIDRLVEQQSDAEDRADKYENWAAILAIIAVALTVLAVVCMICSANPYGVSCGSTTTGGTPPPGWYVSGIEPSGEPEGSTLSMAGGADCMPILMMASQAAMMANSMQQNANQQLETVKQLDQQILTKREMCSSQAFEGMSNAMGSMLPLLM